MAVKKISVVKRNNHQYVADKDLQHLKKILFNHEAFQKISDQFSDVNKQSIDKKRAKNIVKSVRVL